MLTIGPTINTRLAGQGARLRPSMNVTTFNVPGPTSRLYQAATTVCPPTNVAVYIAEARDELHAAIWADH